MKLQNIVFPSYDICSEMPLFFRIDNPANFSFQNGFLCIPDGQYCHFDTYFNALFLNKWKKYTVAKNLSLTLSFSGSFRISILHKVRLENGQVTCRIIKELEATHDKKSDKVIQLPDVSNGMIAFSLYSLKNGSFFYSGYYSCDSDPVRRIHLALCICTFKRERYVRQNMETIIGMDDPVLQGRIDVFISDNAKTLDIPVTNSIHVFQNKNVGGAGGFTRCLIEILKSNNPEITHAVMMDDDIIFSTETLFRTFSLLSLLKEGYSDCCVGGAMLRADRQNIQTESGAVWNGGNLVSLKQGLNMNNCEACLFNDIEETCEYNAWWYNAVPISVVTYDNLPMPIFFRGDDVEFGLRNKKHVILMNGICVWHEPFEYKYSSITFYYIFRNRLIDNSVRSIEYSFSDLKKDFMTQWKNEMKLYRYKNAQLLVDGLADFCKGIDWFKSQDGEALHKEIISRGYKLSDIDDLDFVFRYSMYEDSINGRIPKRRMFARDREVVVSAFSPNLDCFVNVQKALNYDYMGRKGFVTEYDPKEERFQRVYCRKTMSELKSRYDKLYKEYNLRGHELNTIVFWEGYLAEKP